MADLVERARIFATAAHAAVGQKRKYTGKDYIVHPEEVAEIVKRNGGTSEMIAAAWLHDTVEDTQVTFEQIEDEFEATVTRLVEWLTDVSKPSDGNRKTRKAMDRQHTADAPIDAQLVKCADLIANTSSITRHDPDFARVYMREKKMTLEAMRPETKELPLWQQAWYRVEDYYATRENNRLQETLK